MVVAIATDLTLRLHTASTVTNSIEIVAAQIVGLLGFLPSEFVLIEHYDKRGLPHSLFLGRYPEYFYRVELSWDKRKREFHSLKWVMISKEEVEALIEIGLQDVRLERVLWTDWEHAPTIHIEQGITVQ